VIRWFGHRDAAQFQVSTESVSTVNPYDAVSQANLPQLGERNVNAVLGCIV
jgi:hypothetical protein